MLALTNIPGRVVFQAYALSGLYRMRVPLALGIAAVPQAAVQFGDFFPWGNGSLPELAPYWLLGGALALGLCEMNLVGAAVGVSFALRRRSAAEIAFGAPVAMLIMICLPLYLGWGWLGPLLNSPMSSLRPPGIGLWIAIMLILGAGPYLVVWRAFSAERKLL